MRTIQTRWRSITLLLALAFAPGIRAGQTKETPTPALEEYIQDAAKLGLTDADMERYAIQAGWPRGLVVKTIQDVRKSRPAVAAAQPAPPPQIDGKKVVTLPVSLSKRPQPHNAVPAPATVPQDDEVAPGHGVPDDYRIGAGDVLQISVWDEPKASVAATVVRPDGKIGMPLLKEVEVVGLTPTEAEKVITDRLSKLIPAADVAVVVSAINSKKIYVVGAVKKEGPIKYTYRMTVMQAISEAGGLNDYAKRKKIYILRSENGQQYKLPFDYDAVLKGEHMELNVPLVAGDTLVVPH